MLKHSETMTGKQLNRHSQISSTEKEFKDEDFRTERNQIKFIIDNILKGVLYTIQYEYG
jgi:hypothetical protein